MRGLAYTLAMSDDKIPNPHDRFFKSSFSDLALAKDFLRNFLPSGVIACLDLESLEITQDSFVDEQLRSSQSDLLYQVSMESGDTGWVYLLFEHKSYQDPLVPFQLLRYMVRIWERQVREQLPLAPIIPMILYHGQSAWTSPRSMRDVVRAPDELIGYVPTFASHLFDLSQYSDDELRGNADLKASLLLLKYILSDELPQRLPGLLQLFADLHRQRSGLERLKTVLVYLSSGSERVNAQQLSDALRIARDDQGEKLMPTIAQDWIQQGREEGLIKGREEGREAGREEGREEGREAGLRAGIEAIVDLRFPEHAAAIGLLLKEVSSASVLEEVLTTSKTIADTDKLMEFIKSRSAP